MTTDTQTLENQEQQPAPVDVDLEKGVAQEVTPETPPPEQQRTPRPKPRHEERIRILAHERDAERNGRMDMQRQLEEARREAAELRAAKEQSDRAGMENYAARVESEVSAAKAALKAAKEANDPDAEVEAQALLAKAAAAQSDVEVWRQTQPKPGTPPAQVQPREQPRQAPTRQAEPEPSPAVKNFMAENPWFNAARVDESGNFIRHQNGEYVQNDAFDPDMHDAAIIEDKRIQREIRLGKLPQDFMESPAYFERLQNRVREEFPDAFDGEAADSSTPRPGTPPMSQPRQPVAPASRQTQPGSPPPKNGTKMRLDAEQAAFVRSLVDNGTMMYPRNHPDPNKRGQKMSYDDAYITHARNIQADPGSPQNR